MNRKNLQRILTATGIEKDGLLHDRIEAFLSGKTEGRSMGEIVNEYADIVHVIYTDIAHFSYIEDVMRLVNELSVQLGIYYLAIYSSDSDHNPYSLDKFTPPHYNEG